MVFLLQYRPYVLPVMKKWRKRKVKAVYPFTSVLNVVTRYHFKRRENRGGEKVPTFPKNCPLTGENCDKGDCEWYLMGANEGCAIWKIAFELAELNRRNMEDQERR